ncbi:unnamed protein product [Echinostoma caproni]|uniref:Neur_chan_LBD domain-containing protein n=1 Tax=Echinostoma caproni TaxID=27848 RepID=A0A183ALN1_9TREM|nr:unnamed protein product [Echinostoma caproni]
MTDLTNLAKLWKYSQLGAVMLQESWLHNKIEDETVYLDGFANHRIDQPDGNRLYVAHAAISTQVTPKSSQMSREQQVYNRIRKGCEAAVRPLVNPDDTLVVQVKVKLQQLVGLDERTQVLTTLVFIEQSWQDDQLRWNETEYREVRTVRVPANYVWTPDTYVFNNADTSSSGFLKGLHVLVHNSGKVIWQVPMQMKTSCQVDIVMFPFDEQVCDIQMGSWIYMPDWVTYRFHGSLSRGAQIQSSYPEKIIALSACHDTKNSHEALDISSFWESSEWMLLGVELLHSSRSTTQLIAWKMGFGQRPENVVQPKSFNQTTQSDLVLRLHLKRRSFFYLWNIVIPCVMLTLLTITVFCTPVQSGEKITLGLSVFLAFSMFMVLIAEKVPPTSTGIPLIVVGVTKEYSGGKSNSVFVIRRTSFSNSRDPVLGHINARIGSVHRNRKRGVRFYNV